MTQVNYFGNPQPVPFWAQSWGFPLATIGLSYLAQFF
jgi:hypothetical protein